MRNLHSVVAYAGQVREDMEAPFLALLETARRVGRVAEECKLTVDVDEFVGSFRPDLMDVMAAWYRGAKFADVMKMTDVFEVRSGATHGSLLASDRGLEPDGLTLHSSHL